MRPLLAARLAGGLLLATLILTACAKPEPQPYVRLSDLDPTLAAGAQGISPRPVLRVGTYSMLSPTETLLRAGPLFDYLSKRLERHLEVVVPRSYSEAIDMIRREEVHIGVVSSYAYVMGREEFGLEALAVPVYVGLPEHRSVVLVREYSGIEQFSDLKGHSFAFTDPLSTTGRLFPEALISEIGERVERFFEHTIYTTSYDRAIKALDQGVVDGAAVSSIVWHLAVQQDPDLERRLKVIALSEPFGAPPFVVNPRLGSNLKLQMQEVLLQMHRSPEGRGALASLGIDRFVLPEDDWYRSVTRLAERVSGKP